MKTRNEVHKSFLGSEAMMMLKLGLFIELLTAIKYAIV
jgi:hypothetical protein